MNRSLYPDDWEAISLRIRNERAQGKCELCAAPNGLYIFRKLSDPGQWCLATNDEELYWRGEDYNLNMVKVILTVHHIGVAKPDGTPGSPHDKMDCRDENLIALCQRCHLLADLPYHIEKRRLTMKKRRHERIEQAYQDAGQLPLFD
jgi:hypothetical protein